MQQFITEQCIPKFNTLKTQCITNEQNYQQLYFQALKRISQLTSIESELNDTKQMISNEGKRQQIKKYDQNRKELQTKLQQKIQQNKFLMEQHKTIKELCQERQKFNKKKIENQTKIKEVLNEQILLLKQQTMLLRKQLEKQKFMNQKYQKRVSQNHKTIESDQINEQKYQYLKNIIKDQQRQIQEQVNLQNKFKLQIITLSQKNKQLQMQIKQLNQFHNMQLDSKKSLIIHLKNEIDKVNIKYQQLQEINSKLNKNGLFRSLKDSQNLQNNLNSKEQQNKLLKQIISNYQILINQSDLKQQNLQRELSNRQIYIENQKNIIQDSYQQIQWLQKVIQDLKTDFIHSELQKQNFYQKIKKQSKKSLTTSRYLNSTQSTINIHYKSNKKSNTPLQQQKHSHLKNNSTETQNLKSNISLKLNKSYSTLNSDSVFQNVCFTPSASLQNSRLKQPDQTYIKQSSQKTIKKQLNNNLKLQDLKQSFYKKRQSKRISLRPISCFDV